MIYLRHLLLFLATFLTTTLAGVQWLNKSPFELTNFHYGLTYSFLLLSMLSAHEFGHYFAARFHGVQTSLPYYIPFPNLAFLAGLNPFGTLGAVIRLRSAIPSRSVLFDIGAAGPIAGFVVSVIVLATGFINLPPIDYLYSVHPEYVGRGDIPMGGWVFGESLLYSLFAAVFAPPEAFIPPMNEMYHYPFLCVGWFGMLVTAINLIPVGQLDGGHITYAMFAKHHRSVGNISLIVLGGMGILGLLPLVGIDFPYGYPGWLFWAFILYFFIRRSRGSHPLTLDDSPIDGGRMMVGWACLLMFLCCFSPVPIVLQIP